MKKNTLLLLLSASALLMSCGGNNQPASSSSESEPSSSQSTPSSESSAPSSESSVPSSEESSPSESSEASSSEESSESSEETSEASSTTEESTEESSETSEESSEASSSEESSEESSESVDTRAEVTIDISIAGAEGNLVSWDGVNQPTPTIVVTPAVDYDWHYETGDEGTNIGKTLPAEEVWASVVVEVPETATTKAGRSWKVFHFKVVSAEKEDVSIEITVPGVGEDGKTVNWDGKTLPLPVITVTPAVEYDWHFEADEVNIGKSFTAADQWCSVVVEVPETATTNSGRSWKVFHYVVVSAEKADPTVEVTFANQVENKVLWDGVNTPVPTFTVTPNAEIEWHYEVEEVNIGKSFDSLTEKNGFYAAVVYDVAESETVNAKHGWAVFQFLVDEEEEEELVFTVHIHSQGTKTDGTQTYFTLEDCGDIQEAIANLPEADGYTINVVAATGVAVADWGAAVLADADGDLVLGGNNMNSSSGANIALMQEEKADGTTSNIKGAVGAGWSTNFNDRKVGIDARCDDYALARAAYTMLKGAKPAAE